MAITMTEAAAKHIQKQVEKSEITAAAGDESNGQVTVVVSGKLHVRSITIDPRLLAPGNVRYVQDLVTNAVNAALEKAQEIMTEEMKKVTGGLKIPGLNV